jgi:hypothetical protein
MTRILISFIFLSTFFNLSFANSIKYEECLIQNKKYPLEYLSTTNNFISPFGFTNAYTSSLEKANDLNQFKWSIKSVNEQTETFHIASFNNSGLLCPTYSIPDLLRFNNKLKMVIAVVKNVGLRSCEWKLETINDENRSHTKRIIILSSKFNKALYASSIIFSRTHTFKRNVNFDSYKNNSNSNQYEWIINCSKDHF